jgi:phosphoribosylanthranilate isomerase
MPLKTVVKVGNITNLSDARYCSGMGVDMLGFSVIEGTPNYLSPKLFQEIRGWISGPKVVAEIYGLKDTSFLSEIIAQYAPDFFELSAAEFSENINQLTLPCLVSASTFEVDLLNRYTGIRFVIVDNDTVHHSVKSTHPMLLRADSAEKLWETITAHNLAGLALTGSHEIRPGFKEYAALADILESLDE